MGYYQLANKSCSTPTTNGQFVGGGLNGLFDDSIISETTNYNCNSTNILGIVFSDIVFINDIKIYGVNSTPIQNVSINIDGTQFLPTIDSITFSNSFSGTINKRCKSISITRPVSTVVPISKIIVNGIEISNVFNADLSDIIDNDGNFKCKLNILFKTDDFYNKFKDIPVMALLSDGATFDNNDSKILLDFKENKIVLDVNSKNNFSVNLIIVDKQSNSIIVG